MGTAPHLCQAQLWAVEPIPFVRRRREAVVVTEPPRPPADGRPYNGVREACKGLAFFFVVCMLSCLFGAALLGLLTLLDDPTS